MAPPDMNSFTNLLHELLVLIDAAAVGLVGRVSAAVVPHGLHIVLLRSTQGFRTVYYKIILLKQLLYNRD